MQKKTFKLAVVIGLGLHCPLAVGQWTDNGAGNIYCDPLLPPQAVTIGDVAPAANLATLNVRGDELPVNDAFELSRCTFRTDVATDFNQNWSMVRGNTEIARLYHGNPSFHFRIQVRQSAGNLWLQNSLGDGIRVQNTTMGAISLNGYSMFRRAFSAVGDFGAIETGAGGVAGPWARWHLYNREMGANPPVFGYRPWMRNGVMGTGQSDLFYVGQKYAMTDGTGAEQDDNTDLVAAWGDDVLPAGGSQAYNNFSFRYVGSVGVGGSAGTVEGLEMMRLRPYRETAGDPIQGYVGLGDWVNAGGALPTERLDLLDGKVRIRQLPSDATSVSDELVTVNMTTGVLEHRPASALPDNCEWTLWPSGDVYTATGAGGGGCPGSTNTVAIGSTTASNAKLFVRQTNMPGIHYGAIVAECVGYGAGSSVTGVYGQVLPDPSTGPAPAHYGLFGDAENGLSHNFGVYGRANGNTGVNAGTAGSATGTNYNIGASGTGYHGTDNRGVEGTGFGLSCVGNAYGVLGTAWGAQHNYGVFGTYNTEFCGGDPANTFYAGYFAGTVYGAGGLLTPSDERLKDNIKEMKGGLDIVMKLHPKTYSYRTEQFPKMNLPAGPQAGLLAQELEEVIPSLVQDVHQPATRDSTGRMVAEGMDFKGLKLEGLIPYLIQAVQEQQVTIEKMGRRLDEQAEQLAACCAAAGSGVVDTPSEHGSGAVPASDRQLRIQPNPFNEATTVSYTLEKAGRMQLMANSADGKQLRVLEEAQRETGDYRFEWNTAGLAPGVYYVTLLLDGEQLVKKAVKVTR